MILPLPAPRAGGVRHCETVARTRQSAIARSAFDDAFRLRLRAVALRRTGCSSYLTGSAVMNTALLNYAIGIVLLAGTIAVILAILVW